MLCFAFSSHFLILTEIFISLFQYWMKRIVAGSLLWTLTLTLVSFVLPQYVALATWGVDCNQISDVNPLECSALVEIYDNNTLADWSSYAGWFEGLVLGSQDDTVCDWQWVTCTNGAITALSLTNLALDTIPASIANITSLSSLQISYTNITEVPPEISSLALLTSLDLSNNKLTHMPDVQWLGNLEVALFNDNQLTSIRGLWTLNFLHTLTFDNNHLLNIEQWSFDNIPSISTFSIDNNYLTRGMLDENTTIFLDTYAPSRENSQTFENDNILSNVQVAYEQNYRFVTITVDYNLWSGWSVLGNSIIFQFNSNALTPAPSNDPTWRFDNTSGYYYYGLPTSSFEPSSWTIVFTGTLWGKANTGYVYPFYFLLSQRRQEYQYDINTGNNIATWNYQWDASASQFQYCDLIGGTEGKQCRSLVQLAAENPGSTLTSLPGWSALLESTPIITTICDRQGVSCSTKGRANIINLSGTNISTVSSGFFNGLAELSELYLNNNQINTLPDELEEIANLELLDLSHNQLTSLPTTITLLQGLSSLFLNHNEINNLPSELYSLGSYNVLSVLDVSNNNLTSISSDIYDMGWLTSLNISNNELTAIPAEIWTLSNLSSLFFSGNLITSLEPGLFAQIGNNLTVIDVSYNYLARSRLDSSETDILDLLQSDWESTQYTIDLDAPTLSNIHLESSNINDTSIAILWDTISLSFDANEELEVGHLIATIAGQTANVSQQDCGPGIFCYVANIVTDGVSDQWIVAFTIDYEDLFGNTGTQETTTDDFSSVFLDSIGPRISSVHLESDHATNIELATVGNNVLLSFEADEPIATEVLINGNLIDPSSYACASNCYLVTRTITDPGETNGFVTIQITSYDDYGNTGEVINETTDSSNVLIDTTAPSFVNIHIESTHTPSNYATIGDSLIISFETDEELYLTDLVTEWVFINGEAADVVTVPCEGYCYEATFPIDQNRSNDEYTLSIVMKDPAWNVSEEATTTTDGSNVLVDSVSPEHDYTTIVSSNVNNNTLARQGNTITVHFDTSEQIDVTSITGTIADMPISDITTWVSCVMTFCYDIDVIVQSGTTEWPVSFSIYYTDIVGNTSDAWLITTTYDNSFVIVDRTKPQLSHVSTSTPTTNNFAHYGDTIIFTIVSTEELLYAYPLLGGITGDQMALIWTGVCGGAANEYCYEGGVLVDENFSEWTQLIAIDYTDMAWNEWQLFSGTTDNSSVTIDNTDPTISQIHIESNNAYHTGLAKSWDIITVSFKSDEILDTGNSTASIYNANITSSTSELIPFSCSGGFCYKFTSLVDASTQDSAATFEINLIDLAGNQANSISSTTDGSSVTIDNLLAYPLSLDMYSDNENSSDIAISWNIISLLIQTNEPLKEDRIVVLIAEQTWSTYILSGDAGAGCVPYYCYVSQITVNPDSIQWDAALFVEYSDRVGNEKLTITNVMTGDTPVYIDSIIPQIVDIHLESNNTFSHQKAKSDDIISVSFSSSEELSASNIYVEINGDAVSNLTEIPCATYCFSGSILTPPYWSDGPVSLHISYSDDYGNVNNASSTDDASEVAIDNTPPNIITASIASSNDNTSVANDGDDVVLSFETDEEIDLTGAIATIGWQTARLTENACGGICYLATITIDNNFADGEVAVSLSYTDLVGNTWEELSSTTDSSSVEIVRAVNTPSLTSIHIASDNIYDNSFARSGDHIILTFEGNEQLNINNINVDINWQAAIVATGGCWSYCYTATIQVSQAFSNPVSFTIDYTNLQWTAWPQESSVTDGSSVTIDNDAPSLLSASILSSNTQSWTAISGDTIMVYFTTDELLRTGSITLHIANKSTSTIRMTGCPGFCYSGSIVVDDTTTTGNVAFEILYQDTIGNTWTAISSTTDGSSVYIDSSVPTISNIFIFSNNTYTTGAKSGDRITLLFTASEQLMTGSLSGLIAGKWANLQRMSCGGFCYSGSITVDDSTTNGIAWIRIQYADIAGNIGAVRTALTSGSVNIDTQKPLLDTIHISTNNSTPTIGENGDIISLAWRSNEQLNLSSITVTLWGQNASVSETACAGYCYTAEVEIDNNIAAGTVSIAISYQDIIGNIGDTRTSTTDSSSVSISTCAWVIDISENECKTIVSLATALSGTTVSTMSGWSQARGTNAINNVCDWQGISCAWGHIVGLDLSSNNLSSLPSTISSFPYLTAIDISTNNFSTMPTAILNITGLQFFSIAHNELITIPWWSLSSVSSLNVLDVSYNHLARGVITASELNILDTYQINWEDTQTILSDSRLNSSLLSPTSGAQMTGSTMTLGVRYSQGEASASFTGSLRLEVGTGMIGVGSNNWWDSLGSGVYTYMIHPSDSAQNDATILFTGAFVAETETGVMYDFVFTLRSGYDNDDTNNILTGTYTWIDTVLPARSTPGTWKESATPTFNTTNRPILTESKETKPAETINESLPQRGSTTAAPQSSASVYRWAHTNGITTMPLSNARLYVPVQRYEAATMIVNYIKNVARQEIQSRSECDIYQYQDINENINKSVRDVIQDICNLGLMGRGSTTSSLTTNFRPYDTLTTNELQIILRRYDATSLLQINKNRRIDVMDLLMRTLK